MFDIRAHDTAPPAPGDLEPVQRFMNLHEHAPGAGGEVPPSPELVESFLIERGYLRRGDHVSEADHRLALELIEALHAKVRENLGEAMAAEHVAVMDRVAREAGLVPRFGPDGRPRLEPTASGARGALGRMVAIAFLAGLDGSWDRLKECAQDTCRGVFYDHSKNRSGKWCSMQVCGNRAKARAWRERESRARRA